MQKTKQKPDFIYRGSKPVAVVLKIKDYENILEELEDREDLEYIRNLKAKGLETIELDSYLNNRDLSV